VCERKFTEECSWVFVITVVAAVALYAVVCGALFAFQRSLIYYPQPRSNREASTLMTLPVGTATVQVSTHPHAGSAALIYFGGNAEDVSLDVPDLVGAFPSKAIYVLHYPGYGESSGSPSQEAIFADSLALFDRVHAEHPNIIIVGRSLGSGVAVWIASQRRVAHLILVTPFDSLADAAEEQYPFVPVRWLLLDKFESWRYAPRVAAPTRIIVAGDDEGGSTVQFGSTARTIPRWHCFLCCRAHSWAQSYPGQPRILGSSEQ
jgi:pimeloyl-ACP methyl ester carboxylesterase